MEKYINDETIIKNEVYLAFQDSITCPICQNILISPYMCMNCQNVYCKKCIDDWSKRDNKCPNRCENPNYRKSIEKNNALSKLKFKCKKCEMELLYDQVQSHVDTCYSGKKKQIKTTNISKSNEQKMRRLTPSQASNLKKGNETEKITSKINQ